MNIELDKSEQKENVLSSVYPESNKDCEVKIFLNGYLIKTVYAVNEDPQAFLQRVRIGKGDDVKELEIFIVIERGTQKKEIEIRGLLRELLISGWQDN